MTFKIGDRVQPLPGYGNGEMSGVVVGVGAATVVVDHGERLGGQIEWFNWALELVPAPIAPRGPRPLPIRQRVTLTAGKSLRRPAREVWSKVYTLTGPRLRDGERSWYV